MVVFNWLLLSQPKDLEILSGCGKGSHVRTPDRANTQGLNVWKRHRRGGGGCVRVCVHCSPALSPPAPLPTGPPPPLHLSKPRGDSSDGATEAHEVRAHFCSLQREGRNLTSPTLVLTLPQQSAPTSRMG